MSKEEPDATKIIRDALQMRKVKGGVDGSLFYLGQDKTLEEPERKAYARMFLIKPLFRMPLEWKLALVSSLVMNIVLWTLYIIAVVT